MVKIDVDKQKLLESKREYNSPKIVDFGNVRRLTTGGSGMHSEMGDTSHPQKFP